MINKIKFLIWLLPLGFMWLSFYVGSLIIHPTIFYWYSAPYILMAIIIFILLIVLSIYISDKYLE